MLKERGPHILAIDCLYAQEHRSDCVWQKLAEGLYRVDQKSCCVDQRSCPYRHFLHQEYKKARYSAIIEIIRALVPVSCNLKLIHMLCIFTFYKVLTLIQKTQK